MRITLGAFLVGTLVLSSCGGWRDSRVNPTNWFGKSREARIAAPVETVNPLIPQDEDRVNLLGDDAEDAVDRSVPIAVIRDMEISRTPIGAIVTVTGEATRNGAYGAKLVASEVQPDGVLEYTFRVTYPARATYPGTEATRAVRAAVTLTHQDLVGVRSIRVIGRDNARESRR